MTLNFIWAVRYSLVVLIIIILLIPAKYKGSQTLINFSHPNICIDYISDHEEENMDSDETEKMESPGQYAVIKATYFIVTHKKGHNII